MLHDLLSPPGKNFPVFFPPNRNALEIKLQYLANYGVAQLYLVTVSGGSRNLEALCKEFDDLRASFNESRHSDYLKNHSKYETYVHRMICVS